MELEKNNDNEYILEMDFLSVRNNPEVNYFEFLGKKEKVTEETKKILIPNTFFNEGEMKLTSLKLFKDEILINKCVFDIFQGYNHLYCLINEKGYNLQILFNKINDINIQIPIYKDLKIRFDKYDTNNNKYRKRYLIINYNQFAIEINNIIFTIPSLLSKISSYQISFYDIFGKLAVTKRLIIPNSKILFQTYFNKYSNKANSFRKSLTQLINQGQRNFEKKFKKLITDNIALSDLKFYLNQNNEKLAESLNQENFIIFYTNFTLYKILGNINQDYENVKGMLEEIEKMIKQIENEDLQIYQKIRLIENYHGLLLECLTKEDLIKADFTYYIMSKKEKGSILDYVDNFYKEYIELLTEESPIFERLVEIDGGCGFHDKELFYCYNMLNINEVKKHLKEISLNIISTHNLNKKHLAWTNMASGIISINIFNLLKSNLIISLDKKLEDSKIEYGKNIAAKIIYYILHELNGHKKFGYKKDSSTISPKKFIKNGKIYKIQSEDSKEFNDSIIKIAPGNSNKGEGEDGFFFELVYGKIGDYYTIKILDNLEEYGELLDEPNLWVNDLEIFRSYIKIKYAMQVFGIKYKSDKPTIKDKINDYEQKLKSKYKNIDELFKMRKISPYKKKKIEGNKENKPKDFFAFKLNEDFEEKQIEIEGKDDEKGNSQKSSDKNVIIKDINEEKKEENDYKINKGKETIN